MNSKSKWWNDCSGPAEESPRPSNPTEYQIFVGGLSPTVDETLVREIFEREVGAVWEVHILRFRDGRSRGFGLVQFVSKHSVERAMQIGEVKIENNLVKLRLAVEKKQATSQAKVLFRRKVVLFGLNDKLDEFAITEYFKYFGKIEKVMIFEEPVENLTCKPGYVQFDQENCVSAVLDDLQLPQIYVINNQKLLVYSGQAKGTYVKAWRAFFQENLIHSPRDLSKMITLYAKSIMEDAPEKKEPKMLEKPAEKTSTIKTSSQSYKDPAHEPVSIKKRKTQQSQLSRTLNDFDPIGIRFNRSNKYGSKQATLYFGL